MKLQKLSILFFLFGIFLSCKQKIRSKFYSTAQLRTASQKFGLPVSQTFTLDTGYLRYLFSLDTTKYGDQIHDHYQPLQATYYNKAGKLISFHTNCYASIGIADGASLNWNQQNAFAGFVPKSTAPLDSILPLDKHLEFLKTLENKPIDTSGFSKFDFTIIIHWSKNWKPIDCRNLFEIVKRNAATARGERINILYVNDDNSYWWNGR